MICLTSFTWNIFEVHLYISMTPFRDKSKYPKAWDLAWEQGAGCAIRRTSVISPAPMWMLSKVAPIWNILRGCGVDTRRALELLGQLSRANLWAQDLVKDSVSGKKQSGELLNVYHWYSHTCAPTWTQAHPHTNAYTSTHTYKWAMGNVPCLQKI